MLSPGSPFSDAELASATVIPRGIRIKGRRGEEALRKCYGPKSTLHHYKIRIYFCVAQERYLKAMNTIIEDHHVSYKSHLLHSVKIAFFFLEIPF